MHVKSEESLSIDASRPVPSSVSTEDTNAVSNADHMSVESRDDDNGSDADIFSSSDSDIFSADQDRDKTSASLQTETSIFDSDSEDTQSHISLPQQVISTAPRNTLAASRSRRQRNKRSHADYYYDEASEYVIASLSDNQSVTASESSDEEKVEDDDTSTSPPSKRLKLHDAIEESKTDNSMNNLRSRIISE